MAIGTTNLSLRDSLYVEMDKSNGESDYSLGRCKYGQNDIDITAYGTADPAPVSMNYWKNYDHLTMKFRFNPSQTTDGDTYDDTNGIAFGNPEGITVTHTNTSTASPQGVDYNGSTSHSEFEAVGGTVGYKVGEAGIGTICFWVYPRDNSAGQTTILGNDVPFGTVTAYRGYRFDVTTSMYVRVLRGDGTGTASTDRRTFESSGVLVQNAWNFVVWQGEYNTSTIGTNNNYFWIYNDTYGWQAGASFLSGTGGAVAYSNVTGDGLAISTSGNGGRYFDGAVANIYAFDQQLNYTNDIQVLRANTDTYTA